MAIHSAYDRTKFLAEIADPLDTQEGVLSATTQRNKFLTNLAGTAMTAAQLATNAAVTAGVITASKSVVANSDGAITNTGDHLKLNSRLSGGDMAGKTVRLNSITNIGTANDLIGFQSKPAQGAATAKNVIGAEISPRVNDTFALTGSGTLIGLHVDAYLKGTTGNIAGDVRGQQIELVTDDAATRTITGDVIGLRMRAAFSGTISGNMTAIKIEKAETQTNSKQWEYVFELTGDNGLIWSDGYGTEAADENGAFKVRINGQDRWVKTYGTAPIV